MENVSRCRLEMVTCELLYILGPTDMKRWAKVSKIPWGIYDEHEREEEALCESRYWEMVEECWFSDYVTMLTPCGNSCIGGSKSRLV